MITGEITNKTNQSRTIKILVHEMTETRDPEAPPPVFTTMRVCGEFHHWQKWTTEDVRANVMAVNTVYGQSAADRWEEWIERKQREE